MAGIGATQVSFRITEALARARHFSIYKDYQDLYNDSRDARYEADLTFSRSEAQQGQKKRDAIKAVIVPVIAPAPLPKKNP